MDNKERDEPRVQDWSWRLPPPSLLGPRLGPVGAIVSWWHCLSYRGVGWL